MTVVEPLSCLMASVRQLVSLQQGRASSTATNVTTLGLGSTLGSPGAAAPSALTVRCAYIHKLGGLARVYSRCSVTSPALTARPVWSSGLGPADAH